MRMERSLGPLNPEKMDGMEMNLGVSNSIVTPMALNAGDKVKAIRELFRCRN